MNKKEFEEKFKRKFQQHSFTQNLVDDAWQWIEEYGRRQRAEERKEIIEKINLRADKYVYRD